MSKFSEPVNLTDDERKSIVQKKATCPFIGAAVAQGHLKVRNDKNNPLAAIEEVKHLGDSGGGHLGDVLKLFATGNHAFMRSESGELNEPVPDQANLTLYPQITQIDLIICVICGYNPLAFRHRFWSVHTSYRCFAANPATTTRIVIRVSGERIPL